MLSRREYCTTEIAGRLAEKGFAAGEISAATEWLRARGYLSDARFAAAYFESQWKKGMADAVILEELASRGVPETAISAGLERARKDSPPAPDERIMAAAAHCARRNKGLASEKIARRVEAYLARRGYSADQISGVLGRMNLRAGHGRECE